MRICDGSSTIDKGEDMPKYRLCESQKLIYDSVKLYGDDIAQIGGVCIINGEHEIDKLKEAAQYIADRFDIFRIRIEDEDGGIQQFQTDGTTEVEKLQFEDRLQFDEYLHSQNWKAMIGGKLYQIQVARIGADQLAIAAKFHHILIDGWGVLLFTNSVLDQFYGKSDDNSIFTYKSFLEKGLNEKEALLFQKAEAYWLERYAQCGPQRIFEEKSSTLCVKRKEFYLDQQLIDEIAGFCKREHVSQYQLFMSAIALYLKLYSRKNRFYLGTSLLNRKNHQEKHTPGMFVNTVALDFEIFGSDKVRDILNQTGNKILDAFRYQRFNYGNLVSALSREGKESSGLLDVVFSYQNASLDCDYENCSIVWKEPEKQINPLQIHVTDYSRNSKILFHFDYYEDMFPERDITYMFRHICNVIEQVIRQESLVVKDLTIVSEAEMQFYRNTKRKVADPSKGKTVIHLFSEAAQKYPENTAVIYRDYKLSYQELYHRALGLALKLREQGIGRGDIVAICLAKGMELYIGILGILFSGAAYLPIDPDYPEKRKKYMLQNSGCRLLISDRDMDGVCPFFPFNGNYDSFVGSFSPVNEPEDPAYVIYTSGTTGEPKGVLVLHKTLMNLNLFMQTELKPEPEDVILQFANIVFDASVWELWTAFLYGASLLALDKAAILNVGEFYEVTAKYHVSMALLPPQYYLNVTGFAPRILMTGGSVSPREILNTIKAGTSYYNVYGPTENTVLATFWHYDGTFREKTLPIGRTLPNTGFFILFENQICGLEMSGELCLYGESVSKGYLNQTALTAEKFIECPFGRAYRTGDLVKVSDDGEILYLGRIDKQVKVRGFRVELGEIESAMRSLEHVTDAAVINIGEAGAETALCGYYEADRQLRTDDIIKGISQSLPDYMLPKFFVQVDKIPYNINGKLDEARLKQRGIIREKKKLLLPKTEKEKEIAGLMDQILHCGEISMEDSFYELGGDSIKAIRLSSLLLEHGYSLGVQDILTLPNIGAVMSRCVEEIPQRRCGGDEVTGTVAITPVIDRFFDWDFEKPDFFGQCILLKKDHFNSNLVCLAWKKVVTHHDALRLFLRGDRTLVIRAADAVTDNDVCTIELNSEQELDEIKAQVACITGQFDLKKGNIRKAVVCIGKTCDYLALCMHHICVDGVSWRILLEDFINAYEKLQMESTANIILPEKTSSFISWGKYLDGLRKTEAYISDLDYWNKVCQTAAEYVIPYDSIQKESSVGISSGKLERKWTGRLLKDANSYLKTNFQELLLSGLLLSVKRTVGLSGIAVTMESYGRKIQQNTLNFDRTVGWFTAIFPACFKFEEDLARMVTGVKETMRYLDGREIGYGLLKEKLDLRAKDHLMFNYLGDFDEMAEAAESRGYELYPGYDFPVMAKENHGIADIEVNCFIQNGVFSYLLKYDKGCYTQDLMEKLGASWLYALKDICRYLLSRTGVVSTPADFGYPCMDLSDFQQILCVYGKDVIESINPLTYLQQGMLYYKQLDEGASSYIVQNVIRISGSKSIHVLTEAFEMLVQKHAILRSSVIYRTVTRPFLVVLKSRACEICLSDAEVKNEEELDACLEKLMESDRNKGYDLERDPLLRVYFVKKEDCYYVLWSFHHIIMDGWCVPLLFREYTEFCDAMEHGSRCEIKSEDIFRSYAAWQQKQNLEEKLDYWERLLCDYDGMTGIKPLKRNRKRLKASPAKNTATVEDGVVSRIQDFCRRHEVTVDALFEAALGCLLFNYNNCLDAVFGKVVSGRNVNLNGISEAVGLFINTVPVRLQNEDDLTCLSFIKCANAQNVEGLDYHHCPLAEIQRRCRKGEELFQVLLVFENSNQIITEQTEYRIEYQYNREETSYDLTVSVNFNQYMEIEILYDANKYTACEIALFAERLIHVAAGMVRHPDGKLNEIEFILEDEKKAILSANERNTADYPYHTAVGTLFDEVAALHPDKTAVIFEHDRITYDSLKARANHLASVLRAKGIGRNDFVAVLEERGIGLIVAILAVIKAGAAYVPIDYRYPAERIRFILEDCGPKCVLSDCGAAAWSFGFDLVSIAENSIPDAFSDAYLEDWNRADDLAYMIYTSGTSGKPKGVMIEHHSLVNMIYAYKDIYEMKEEDIILQFASIAFDQSVWDIFSALLTGAGLLMVPQAYIGDPVRLPEYANQHKATVAALTPAFIRELDSNSFRYLRLLESGGAEAKPDVLRQWLGRVRIFNTYGPTEAAVNAVTFELKEDAEEMPIGSPIPNTQVYVIDRGRLCGAGIAGELCIAGQGIARGYYNREELTAEKFVENPFGTGRIYRTGDLARLIDEHVIEYLGRIDDQVKIRGFRIELGEIEHALRDVSGITDAVVITQKEPDGEQYLCAYFTAEIKLDQSLIFSKLKDSLPSYMVPRCMMQIPSIPLTSNGKVDRNKLPEIPVSSEALYEEPKDQTERLVAACFEEVLGIKRAGLNDNFFESGGHSLKAVSLVNAIEKRTSVRLEIGSILKNQSVREIAEVLKSKTEETREPVMKKAPKREYYEMSSAQKRLYILDSMEESMAYHMGAAVKIKGSLDEECVRTSLQAIVDRHDILRTGFYTIDGSLCQKIADQGTLEFESLHVSGPKEADSHMKTFKRAFDLKKPPLMRAKLLILNENEHILLFDIHHIVADGITINLILSEFSRLYQGKTLDEVVYSYADYCEWCKKRDLGSQKRYWNQLLGEDLPVLDLPLDYPRPRTQSFQGEIQKSVIDESIVGQVQRFAALHGVTEFAVCMSAMMIMLCKYSQQEDIVIGMPVSGRTNSILEQMPGLFVNTIVLRGAPEAAKRYIDFLHEIEESCYQALDHQDYPFEQLVEDVVVTRDMSRNPIFDIMVSYEEETNELKMDGLEFEEQSLPGKESRFDITFAITKKDKEYRITAEYCTGLFTKESIRYMLKHFEQLLKEVIGNPEQIIGEISMTDQAETESILHSFHGPAAGEAADGTIMDYFEACVLKTPGLAALQDVDRVLSYSDLNEAANQYAWYLKESGVETEDAVVIAAERSIELVIAIYAVLKAGGMYVPVDAQCPGERFEYIVHDSAAKLIITDQPKRFRTDSCKVIPLNLNVSKTMPKGNLKSVTGKHNLMYMIYTSGTTGYPKGVEIEHHSLVNLIMNMQKRYPVHVGEAYLFKTSFTFDVSLNELFGWFLDGGRLAVLKRGGEKDPVAIAEAIERFGITHAAFVPSMLNVFLNTVKTLKADLSSMKYLLTLGEPVTSETAGMCYTLFHNTELINLYGPTEATIYASCYPVKRIEAAATVPIGRPLDHVRLFVCDEALRLCGINVPGELMIAGEGLARGYRNQPGLTEKSFVPNPFGKGSLLYKTGDRARLLPDGNIEYLGRMDQQVKVRGYRIELGEIENAARRSGLVRDAVAVVRKNSMGENDICVYITNDNDVDITLLKQVMAGKLPAYMVPSYIMQIAGIPVNRSGKLDKNKLPDIVMPESTAAAVPENPLQERILAIVSGVLDKQRLGITDNFFEVGGQSIRAIKVINEIEEKEGIRVGLKDFFEHPTVLSLSQYITDRRKNAGCPVKKAEGRPYYELSSAQRRIYIAGSLDDEGISYNMPVMLEVSGILDSEKVQKSMETLIARHEILRTQLALWDGNIVQEIKERVPFEVSVIEDPEFGPEHMVRYVKKFDLFHAPLIRTVLIKDHELHGYLFFDIHHIIADQRTLDILIKEFAAAYEDRELPEVTIGYVDYIEWMKNRDLKSHKEYWMNVFRDSIPVLELPLDGKRPKFQKFQGKVYQCAVSETLMKEIKALAAECHATEYMVFLAVFSLLLSKYSRQYDFVIGTPVAGRTAAGLFDVTGVFTNTLPLRMHPEPEKPFADYLKEVRELCLEGLDHQDYPLEDLIDQLPLERNQARNPLFDVVFALQDRGETRFELPGAELRILSEQAQSSKFDLTFTIVKDQDGSHVEWEYAADLFMDETIDYMNRHYIQLLKEIVRDRDQALSDFNSMDRAERELVLETFQGAVAEYPAASNLAALFEQQAVKFPDRIAVADRKEEMTYFELNRRADALASNIAGDRSEHKLVAVMADKNIRSIIGILAILKAGCAYVPIDRKSPEERNRLILEDCKPDVLLYSEKKSPDLNGMKTIDLYDEANYAGVYDKKEVKIKPEDPAYVIFTSGTTGRPKGIVIEHRSVINLIHNTEFVKMGTETVLLQASSLAFDSSVFDIFGTLLHGGKLCMADAEMLADAEGFRKALKDFRCNTVLVTTALFNQLVSLDPTVFDGLSYLMIGGEAASEDHIDRMKSRNVQFMNIYGPTENTAYTSYYIIPGKRKYQKTPIGKPLANIRLYVITDEQLCGIGIPGELCIEGDGLARGYLNREELTAEKFAVNPFTGHRMYRTGDLVRWLPDGNIEYLGRMDGQVKIHGYRIELGEIESSVMKYPGVTEAVACVRNNSNKYIELFFTADLEVDLKILKKNLKESLPEYMVPGYMMQLPAIPLNHSGKVNLPALPKAGYVREAEYAEPETKVQRMVAELFGRILDTEKVGLYDDFFQSGGNSINAVNLVNRINSQFQVSVTIKDMFTSGTVAGIAGLVEQWNGEKLYRIPKAKARKLYPVSAAQKRMFILDQFDHLNTGYNMPVMLKVDGILDIERYTQAVSKLIERHESLRTVFTVEAEGIRQRILKDLKIEIPVIQTTGDSVRNLFSRFIRPFDLKLGPLIRCEILCVTDHLFYIFIDMHHIIADGTSAGIIVTDLMKLYDHKTLQNIEVSYKDYAEWEQQLADTAEYQKSKAYWIDLWKEGIPKLELFADFQRPAVLDFGGGSIHKIMDRKDQEMLNEFALKHKTTLYMVFMSAYGLLLHQYSGQKHLIVGSPVANRQALELENVVGMFVNMIAVPFHIEPEMFYADYLSQVKQTCVEAFEHQIYPFDQLVEDLNIERDPGRNPVFDATLSMQNMKFPQFQLDGAKVTVEDHAPETKYDVMLFVQEAADGILLQLDYRTSLFLEHTAITMLKDFMTILLNAAKHPQCRLNELLVRTETSYTKKIAEERKKLEIDFEF